MSKNTKMWLVIAASLVIIGGIIFGGVMTMLKWDFSKLSTVKYETNNYAIDEAYKNISIVTDTADVLFVPAKNQETSIVCHEQKNMKHSVAVNDDTLVINVVDTRKWYEYFGISFGASKITVYIPQGEYSTLRVKSSTGDVEIPKDFKFESVDISENTGNVTNYASASEMIKIKTSTGDIRVENASAGALDLSVSTGGINMDNITCEGDINTRVSTGKTNITDTKCKNIISSGNTGDLSLKNVIATENFSIERSTGDIMLDGSDAAEIFIQTDTGNIKGSLLSDKVFITNSDTGSVNVPKTANGGKCEIITDTGDIKITINYP